MTTVITNPDPDLLQAITVKHACKLYANTKIRPNRHTTPTRLLELASQFTGKTYKRGQHMRAYHDLDALLQAVMEGDIHRESPEIN